MNSADYPVAEIDTQSFWTSFKVTKSYSTSLLISLFMIPVVHIIFCGNQYAIVIWIKNFRRDAIASTFADFVVIGDHQTYCFK